MELTAFGLQSPARTCTFLSDRFASSFGRKKQKKTMGCCSQHVWYLLIPCVSKPACPWCGSLPQCISEKQLAYQAAGRGLMNRLCDLPPDRRRDRQPHWNQRQKQTVILRHNCRVLTYSYNMVLLCRTVPDNSQPVLKSEVHLKFYSVVLHF